MFLLERKKVLIVDDEPDIRDMLSILLASNGYTAVEAKNGVEAVNAVKENHDFDLVILDVMMPEMDGIRFKRNKKVQQRSRAFSYGKNSRKRQGGRIL